jgi:hypothetical protein
MNYKYGKALSNVNVYTNFHEYSSIGSKVIREDSYTDIIP